MPDPGAVGRFYSTVPPLTAVTLRSVHVDRRGRGSPCGSICRRSPTGVPPEWAGHGYDRFQCHVQFLAVDDVVLDGWVAAGTADVALVARDRRRLAVDVRATAGRLTFTSSDSVLAGRFSAHRAAADGSDRGPRHYVSKVDRIRFDGLPDVSQRDFYERV
ncbi:Imm50 family immunity protein [Streptomyces sp. M19]